MKLETANLTFAVAFTTLAAWILCAAVVAVLPGMSMSMTQHMLHMPSGTFGWHITWVGFFAGAIIWTLAAAAFAWCAASVYNARVDD